MSSQKNEIKIITGLSSDSITSEITESHEPILLKDIVSDWPVVKSGKKSPSHAMNYIERFSTEEPWTVFEGGPNSDGRVFYNPEFTGFNYDVTRMAFSKLKSMLGESLDQIDPKMLYVGSTMIDRWLPGFSSENSIQIPCYEHLASIWMGNKSRIAAHFDFASNIACCVVGRRRFTLFPPDQLENLYVGPIDFTPAGQPISLVDFKKPDFKKFPKFSHALKTAIVVELEPGDALLVPSMWWHHVEALEDLNVLVNFWWRSSPRYLGSPLNVLQHALMGLRDLPPTQRKVWQHLFEYYVFEPHDENFEHIPHHAKGVLNQMNEQLSLEIRNLLINRLKR